MKAVKAISCWRISGRRFVCVSWLCLIGVCESHWVFAGSPLAELQARATRQSLVGTWSASVGQEKIDLELTSEGRFALGDKAGTYLIEGNELRLRVGDEETPYPFQLSGDQLTLSGGDLPEEIEIVFSRRSEITDYTLWLLDISPRSAARKFYRVLVIVSILLIAALIIRLLKGLSRLLIFSDWGPFGLLYRTHRNRVLTIHSLLLNLIKYVIYFTALGFILSELGINYTAYLVPLSVIGLAIGFGSQGLVQDMVTGFFVIFENQYDVGDMVEISGQVGIVEELGLRRTRLRNYLGQTVAIPNRSIALVGNFAKGAQHAYIHVATSPEAGSHASKILEQIADELARQFSGVILTRPEPQEPLSLTTNEHFARLAIAIWPRQQWVVEEQLVPRIREVFKREGLEIPGDRVAVFYHARKQHQIRTFWRPHADASTDPTT